MDKVFSTRLDEELIRKINLLAVKKSVSKKKLIEKALRSYLNERKDNAESDAIDRAFGLWKRDETPEQTIRNVRNTFREAFTRHEQTGGEK